VTRFSYIIVTHNRRDTLLATLARLPQATDLPQHQWDCWVVDNASTDGTPDAVARQFPWVRLLRHEHNRGPGARSDALPLIDSPLVVFLDDDSYPLPGAIGPMLAPFDEQPKLAALTARVELPDGRCEASALPMAPIGCAMAARRDALLAVGGFDHALMRQAEEFEIAMRLLHAGWSIDRADHVTFRHDKSPSNRPMNLIRQLDLRNNLVIAARYLPRGLARRYRADWSLRYSAIARHGNARDEAREGRRQARAWHACDSVLGCVPFRDDAIEQMFHLQQQAREVARWSREHNIRRVVIGDFGKNLYATWHACVQAGLHVQAIADNAPCFAGLVYRGAPILTDEQALRQRVDGIVVSNINPAQVDERCAQLARAFAGPLLRLWHPHTRRAAEPVVVTLNPRPTSQVA
jgi:GT2 family glycosyltransferase